MPKYGLVIPGEERIHDIVENTFTVAPPFEWKAAPDDVSTQWIWNGSAFQAPAAKPISDIKADRKAYINNRRDAAMLANIAFDSNPYEVSPQVRSDLTAAITFIEVATAAGLPGVPSTVSWRDANNVDRDLTKAELLGLAAAMFTAVQTAHVTARTLKDAIDSATTEAAVNAIDWP